MMNNNAVDFLLSLGWDINISNKNNKICESPYYDSDEDLFINPDDCNYESSRFFSIEDALEVEKLDHPTEYEEYIMMDNLYSSNYIGKGSCEDY